MNRELSNVLTWAWDNRAEILRRANPVPINSYSYGTDPFTNGAVLYINDYLGAREFNTANAEQPPNDDEAAVAKFLDSLWVIATNVGCKELELNYISSNRSMHKTMKVRGNSIQNLKRMRYRGASFVFRKSAGVAAGQIYVNLAQRGRIPALLELIDDVWDVNGLVCVKVAGPWSDRIDTAVIEFANGTAQRAIIDRLTAYAQRNRQFMRNERRKLTMPVANLPGVSLGMQPPDVNVKQTNDGVEFSNRAQSYGIYRAQLIFMALERTERPTPETLKSRWFNAKSFRKFKKRVEQYFGDAGINTNKPWTQSGSTAEAAEGQQLGIATAKVIANKKFVPDYDQQVTNLANKKRTEKLPAHKKYKPVWPHGNNQGGMANNTGNAAHRGGGVHNNLHRGGLI